MVLSTYIEWFATDGTEEAGSGQMGVGQAFGQFVDAVADNATGICLLFALWSFVHSNSG
jgi:hypothetical protein